MRYLLDTSAILTHHRKEQGWEIVHALLEDETVEITVASVCLAEMARRLHDLGATDGQALADVAAYEAISEVLPVDAAVARAAYSLGRTCPSRLPMIDALIAATAQIHDATLVHRDQHLQQLPTAHLRQLNLANET